MDVVPRRAGPPADESPQGALLVGIGRQGTGERAGHMRTLTKTVPTDEPQCPGTIRNPRRARGSRG